MAQPYTINLEDIQNSPKLRELGVLPGDELINDEIVRKFSSEEDRVDLGEKISEQDVFNSPTLQELGAKPGDRIVNDELISTETDDTFTQFMYGYDKQNNFVGYVSDVLERNMPLGQFSISLDKGFQYHTPEAVYGEGFDEASIEERKNMILRKRERALMEEYGPYFDPDGGTAQSIGEITGSIADVTTLLPVGHTIKAAGALSALYGGSYSVAQDLAEQGEIDVGKAALYAGIGGVAGAGITVIGKAIKPSTLEKKATNLVEQAEKDINTEIAYGITPKSAQKMIEKEYPQLTEALEISGRKLKIAPTQSIAEKSINHTLANDSAVGRILNPYLDKYLGVLSTRIGNISQPILRRMKRFEYDIHANTHKKMVEIKPFINGMSSLNKTNPTAYKNVSRALANGNFETAKKSMPESLRKEFTKAEGIEKGLNKMFEDLGDSGLVFKKTENYFPRIVKDYEGLIKNLSGYEKTQIQKLQQEYAKRQGKASVAQLSDQEKSEIANLYLRGYGLKTDGLPKFAKPRKIKNLTDEQLEFYTSPEESLALYFRNAINTVERNKFFGRNLVKAKGDVDIDQSVGKLLSEETTLTPRQVEDLSGLIKSRFIGGEQSTGTGIGILKDLGYMGTIANPISAIVQLGDLGVSGALNGFRNTFAAMFGTKNIKLIDLGLDNIMQELSLDGARLSSKALNKMFDISGFRTLDRLGKETFINAAFKKAINQVKTPAGKRAFKRKWGQFYGDDIHAIIDDLADYSPKRTGGDGITDNIKFHAFNELSGIQPVSMLEMPQPYLDNPNIGRISYMLKSFMIKQLDVARRGVVQEFKKGNKKTAIKNAALLAGYLSAANVGTRLTRDVLLGRDIEPEQIPTQAMWALTGVYGIDKYSTEKYLQEGKPTEYVVNFIVPATPIIDAAFKTGKKGIDAIYGEDVDFKPAFKAIPLVGPLAYNWFGGGAEKYNERLEKESE
tara:strand:+ start:2257 stop:5133 length:2877 start_codon:yes stop_codon:yes gene_type:complete